MAPTGTLGGKVEQRWRQVITPQYPSAIPSTAVSHTYRIAKTLGLH